MSSDSKYSFFRQSGWMVVSTFLGGVFMVGVQIAAQNPRVMESSDVTTFIALLGLLIIFGGVPSSALQTIFAQQAAAAVTDEKMGELTATLRALLWNTFIFWLVVASVVIIFAGPASSALGLNDPVALRIAMLAVLAVVWLPTFKGVLQGLHRFASLGWLQIMEGILRLAIFFLLVMWLKGRAAGGLWAVFAAAYLTLALAIWLTRDVWRPKTSATFSWKVWLIRGAPLTLAMGAYISMSSLDRVFVKSLFPAPHSAQAAAVKLYYQAMLVGYAIGQFISPITAVMFPTIVRNLALSKKTDALLLTLVATGIFGCLFVSGIASGGSSFQARGRSLGPLVCMVAPAAHHGQCPHPKPDGTGTLLRLAMAHFGSRLLCFGAHADFAAHGENGGPQHPDAGNNRS